MLRYLFSLALLASAIPAQSITSDNVTLEVLAVDDTRIRVRVEDALSPRPGEYTVIRIGDGGQTTPVASGVFQTPLPGAWVPGLEPWSNYQITVAVGTASSEESVDVQTWTTWDGITRGAFVDVIPTVVKESSPELVRRHYELVTRYPNRALDILTASSEANWVQAHGYLLGVLDAYDRRERARREPEPARGWD